MSRIYSEEKRRERAEYAKEWRRRNPDKVAANRKKERDKFESDPIAKFARNADARERFAEKMKCPEYRKFHAARTAKAKQKDRVAYVSSYIMNAAKQRAEQLGLPFDLHEHADDMKKRISALKCELTGLPL